MANGWVDFAARKDSFCGQLLAHFGEGFWLNSDARDRTKIRANNDIDFVPILIKNISEQICSNSLYFDIH